MKTVAPQIQVSVTEPNVQVQPPAMPSGTQVRQQSRPTHEKSSDDLERPTGLVNSKGVYAEGAMLTSSRGRFREAAQLIINDKKKYESIQKAITERYKSFDQAKEVGHGGRPGVTGDIADISLNDLCSILRHIAVNPEKMEVAAKKSAISPLFDKLYLMQSKEQGWALRLHKFAPGEKAQGDEEMPHYHRWTLASKLLSGGYNNKNYTEISADDANAEETYYKYSLKPSADGTEREFTRQEPFEVGMQVSRQTLFKKGNVRHFPIELPHSVSDLSRHTGTTLTLAHTGKGAKETSLAYEKDPALNSKPLDKPATSEEFAASILDKIALLQVISLADKLHDHLQSKGTLTPDEQRHIEDHSAPNYIETSLLPAVAILELEDSSSEFSKETQDFIRGQMKSISGQNLRSLLEENQKNIEKGAFSTSISSWGELERLISPQNESAA